MNRQTRVIKHEQQTVSTEAWRPVLRDQISKSAVDTVRKPGEVLLSTTVKIARWSVFLEAKYKEAGTGHG